MLFIDAYFVFFTSSNSSLAVQPIKTPRIRTPRSPFDIMQCENPIISRYPSIFQIKSCTVDMKTIKNKFANQSYAYPLIPVEMRFIDSKSGFRF